jgi:hypothetical protein
MSRDTIDTKDDNIYVNINIKSDNSQNDTIVEYSTTKTIPILSKCSDYYCSVIRFQIPLVDVPLFIMPIIPNQPNPNLTPFTIHISYGGNLYSQPLIYTPVITGLTPPIQNQPSQVITLYYYVFDYQVLINMINLAISNAFLASPLGALTPNMPYFYYDALNTILVLVADTTYFAPLSTSITPNPIPQANLYINSDLQTFISAFSTIYDSSIGLYRLNLIQFGLQNTIPPFTPSATFRTYPQEYSTFQNFSSLKKIIISSNTIPISNEFVPNNNNSISSTFPILTDFIPIITNVSDVRSIAFYNPSAQYRLLDLKSDEQLNNINIKVYWQDQYLNLYPLYIQKYTEASIKIGFFKKTMYNSKLLPLK